MLVPLGGHKEFVNEAGFSDDLLATYLELTEWVDDDDWRFDRKAVLKSLRNQYKWVEQNASKASLPSTLSSNIDHLAHLIGLNDTESEILAFAICLQADAQLEECAQFLGELNRLKLIEVLSSVLGIEDDRLKIALGHRGVLCLSGLIKVKGQRYSLGDKLDVLSDQFVDHMVSDDGQVLNHFRETVFTSPPSHLVISDYPHIKAELDLLVPYLRQALLAHRKGVNVLVYGLPGTGKTRLIRVLSQELDVQLYEVSSEDSSGEPRDGERRLRAYVMGQHLLANRRSMMLFDEIEDVFNDGGFFEQSTAQIHKGWVNRILEENVIPTFWVSNNIRGMDPAMIRRFDMVFELPVPPKRVRQRIIHKVCGDAIEHDEIDALVQTDNLAPAVITRAFSVVKTAQCERGTIDTVEASRLLINNTLLAQGHPAIPPYGRSAVSHLYDPDFINADIDLTALSFNMQDHPSGCLCLHGPPGTGKTAFAHWLADQLQLSIVSKRASDLISKWLGQSEQNIADAFREAEREGALLLIDEIDGFLQDRRRAQQSWEVTLVNEMLTQMEAFSGLFVASTNLLLDLDQSALRRFDLKIQFDYLRSDQAWSLLKRYCENRELGQLSETHKTRLKSVRAMTPGDFATIARRHRIKPIGSPCELIQALEAECAHKEDAQPSIGFVH